MRNRRLWMVLGGIVALCAAFLFLSFRASVSNTQAEKNSVSMSSGDRLPDAMQRRDKISIAVVGEGPLVSTLQDALAAEIRKSGMGEFELVPGIEPAFPNPVLIVKVGNPSLIWTPFFATSQFSIEAGFASNGDTTFMGDTPITYNSIDGPTLNMSADYKISDQSWGLISLPGYHQFLAEYLAKQIVASLKDLYKV